MATELLGNWFDLITVVGLIIVLMWGINGILDSIYKSSKEYKDFEALKKDPVFIKYIYDIADSVLKMSEIMADFGKEKKSDKEE